MRRIIQAGLVAAVLISLDCGGGYQTANVSRRTNGPFTVLDAYGEWIDYPELGTVWQPNVAFDWRPFSDGRWIWTDRGWMWESNEPFGWVVYHYGYWVHRGAAGWLWVPEYTWSPARVRWYTKDDVIGWAPLPLAGKRYGDEDGWTVVPAQSFTRERVGNYRRGLISPTDVSGGLRPPDVRMVEKATNERIEATRTTEERVPAGQRDLTRVRAEPAPPRPALPLREDGAKREPLPTGNTPVPPPVNQGNINPPAGGSAPQKDNTFRKKNESGARQSSKERLPSGKDTKGNAKSQKQAGKREDGSKRTNEGKSPERKGRGQSNDERK